MAELKRNFSQGRMNKDLDVRVVQPGEYRDANNVEIATSEGSDVGTIQAVLGNTERTKLSSDSSLQHHNQSVLSSATCVASIADEKTTKYIH